jgi:hypothetical protein
MPMTDAQRRADLRARAQDLSMTLYPVTEEQVAILIAQAQNSGTLDDVRRAQHVLELLRSAMSELHAIGREQ